MEAPGMQGEISCKHVSHHTNPVDGNFLSINIDVFGDHRVRTGQCSSWLQASERHPRPDPANFPNQSGVSGRCRRQALPRERTGCWDMMTPVTDPGGDDETNADHLLCNTDNQA